ncbi:MAG TPA: hypothetical protein VNG31_08865, partial [Candidatus Baltobacteraceae bacterium]|nr:hypothetical protein [Candidatus Baltobacteraceae bacterium]
MASLRRSAALLVAALLTACAGNGVVPAQMRPANGFATHRTVEIANGITPRLQWMYNYGYCGETSLISAGLFYGQYLSQYDARHLAHPNIPQSQDASQLLLTLNAARVARRMHLQTVEWNSGDRSSRDFLA